VSSLKERLRYSNEVARKALINTKEVTKRYHDQKEDAVTYREDDLVLLLQQRVRRACSEKTFFSVDRTIYRGRSQRSKLCITLRHEKSNLQGAQQQTSAFHLISDRHATRGVVGFERDVHRRHFRRMLHSQEL
jgi:hypothetical protein